MKKISVLVMLLGIITFSLIQSCRSEKKTGGTDQPKALTDTVCDSIFYEPKKTVCIYLTSIKLFGTNCDTSYHLAMFDANGDYAIDTLTTYFFPGENIPGQIKWKKAEHSGIQQIIAIKPVEGVQKNIIFQKSVKEDPITGEWNLDLPIDTLIQLTQVDNQRIREKYIIRYIPENYNGKEPIEIDPHLEVPPPEGSY